MRCYFYSRSLEDPGHRGPGVVTFVIPDLDITFRARYMGTEIECHYAALLALLEFADINPKLFKQKILQIFSDNIAVVGQINQQINCRKEHEPLLQMALTYKRKIAYSLGWVAPADNPATDFLDFE